MKNADLMNKSISEERLAAAAQEMYRALLACHDHLLMNDKTSTRTFRLVIAALDKAEKQ